MEKRAAGILLHPTSLPSRFGVGDLGPEIDRFLDWAQSGGFTVWQLLPLGPPAFGHSPYNCLSAFAGNPLLISPQQLVIDGWLEASDLDDAPDFGSTGSVLFSGALSWKMSLLLHAWERFRSRGSSEQKESLEAFCQTPEQLLWLDEWALFSALRERFEGKGWWDWPVGLARRDPKSLEIARQQESARMGFHRFQQFLFFSQWDRVKKSARSRGIRLLGDLPIYVARDSAEVWALPHLFDLDESGIPRAVAGVPPDYFSADGQLWGNPLFRWDQMAEDDFAWWTQRLAANLRLTDWVRMDHFRGFAGYWRVPAGESTAINGRWEKGPGHPLFEAMERALGKLPLVAEDLGEITPDVHALRDGLGLPGMRVLHFGFDELGSDHAPHKFYEATVVYTGTHDNNTSVGWWQELEPVVRERVTRYLGDVEDIAGALIRCAYTSVARLAIVPAQDVLRLDGTSRMNIPGVAEGNWSWRLEADSLNPEIAKDLRALAEISGRI